MKKGEKYKRSYIKNNQVKSVTIRIDLDEVDRYRDIYMYHTTGLEVAVKTHLYIRNIAIKEIKKTITEEDFVSINELVDIELLGPKTMYDRDIMLKSMKNKYEVAGGFSFSFKNLEKKLMKITPERFLFLFTELFRYRRYLDQVPNYNPREFFNEEIV